MTLEEQRQQLLQAGWSAISKDQELKNALVGVFKQVGQEVCNTCPSVLYNRYLDLKHKKIFQLKNLTPMSERKFIMKSESFTVRPNGPTYLRDSITDDEAVQLIKENPDRAASFEVKGDLDEIISEYDKRQQKTAKKSSSDDDKKTSQKQASDSDSDKKKSDSGKK